ncbi:MAG: DNA recombination protein RmuC [Chloroflexi bacterium]|nr:DNA recombination protein RmuC [Chloroflexota bacterium]
MELILVFAGGFLLGALVIALLVSFTTRNSQNKLKKDFADISQQVLYQASEHMMRLNAGQTQMNNSQLEHKKELIDVSLNEMRGKLERVERSLNDFNEKREVSFQTLNDQIKAAAGQTEKLADSTAQLREMLSSSRSRGQWGERMAEDILRLAGLCEGINYYKQKTQENFQSRPDYTFKLPQELIVNMDVKFPFENYLNYEQCSDISFKEDYKKRFLKDVRNRVKEVTSREYINPAEHTVDYALVFIPSENIYSFINEHDPSIMDDALKMKIILCSPHTLYAVLSVMRAAVENFKMSTRLGEVLSLIEDFKNQWRKYCEKMEILGDRLESAKKDFDELQGVRTRSLDRSLNKIENAQEDNYLLEATSDKIS